MHFSPPYLLFPGDPLELHFHPEHWADLRASGLKEETIREAAVYSLSPNFITHYFSFTGKTKYLPLINSALAFPYQGGDFARIKLFPALDKRKYAQPPNTSARLYVPFSIKNDTLYITEGEKKCLAAHQAGLNAVGIGGVWNWLTKGHPIADLGLVQWEDREVVIVPDSDVSMRPDLLNAIYALGRELRNEGAVVRVAELPQGEQKVGLDDYLFAGGDVQNLETFSLDQRVFRSCRSWFGRWKLKTALAA